MTDYMINFGKGTMGSLEEVIFFCFRVKCSVYTYQIHYVSITWYIGDSGVLQSTTIIVWGSMCVLSISKVSFMNEGSLAFGALMFRIETFPEWIFSLMNMKCPPSCLITFG